MALTAGAAQRPENGERERDSKKDALGRYELIQRIAVGGMAELFLARAVGLKGFEKQVVLKRILPEHARDGEFIRLFLQEARLAATLHHANIVQVYDIGKVGETYFFTMEYVQGVDARRVLKQAKNNNIFIPIEHAVSIVLGAAAGLHYAHEKRDARGVHLGLVHRDVSPSNILIGAEGAVKILDFGIAKATHGRSETRPGLIRGKICYMSPEQCEGEVLDRRSDIFALGILLFELTTSSALFDGENDVATMRQILDHPVPLPSLRRPDYPPELEQIVMRALHREPEGRYATAQELQRELERFAFSHRLPVSSLGLSEYIGQFVQPLPTDSLGQTVIIELTSSDLKEEEEEEPAEKSAAVASATEPHVPAWQAAESPPALVVPRVYSASSGRTTAQLFSTRLILPLLGALGLVLSLAGFWRLMSPTGAGTPPAVQTPPVEKAEVQPLIPYPAPAVVTSPATAPVTAISGETAPSTRSSHTRGKKRKRPIRRPPAAGPAKRSPDLVDPFGS